VVAWDDGASDSAEPASVDLSGPRPAQVDRWLWHQPTLGQVDRVEEPLVLDSLDQAMSAGAAYLDSVSPGPFQS